MDELDKLIREEGVKRKKAYDDFQQQCKATYDAMAKKLEEQGFIPKATKDKLDELREHIKLVYLASSYTALLFEAFLVRINELPVKGEEEYGPDESKDKV